MVRAPGGRVKEFSAVASRLPEGFCGPDEPGWEDLPVREALVDHYEALTKHLGLTEALRQELHAGQSTEVYEQLLEHIEFGLHRGERNRLYSLLVHKDS